MASNFLYIPFKKTKNISLADELKQVIKKDYFQSPSIFENDLQQLHKLRKKITKLQDEQVDKGTEIIVKHYYIQLVNLTRKFADEVLEFQWYSTLGYKPSGPYRLRSLTFEQFNIIYQLGSLYSQLVIKESSYSDDGLRKACNYLQLSAGCYQFLIDQIEQSNHKYSQDFSYETLQHLKYLMLAQAQESIWLKAVNSEMKNSAISKLSIETSNLYYRAYENGSKSDFIKLETMNHTLVKHYHFKAAAHYRVSIMALDDLKYGEQIAHLRVAQAAYEQGLKHKRYVKEIVLEDLKGLGSMIATTLRAAEKENDLIYLKPVPDKKDLPPLTGALMVNPITMTEFEEPLTSDRLFFNELLPYLIVQVAMAYRERQDSFILKTILEPLQSLNTMMNHFLTERHLPATIDSIQKPENIPESIINHSKDIITFGGIDMIENSYDKILQLSSDCRDIYEGCHQRLTIEGEEDELFRDKFGTKWTRTKSDEAAQELWIKVNSMEEYLGQADQADDIILTNYHDIKEYLELYSGGFESLKEFIPSSTYMDLSKEVSWIVSDMREAINETNELEQSRKQFLHRLEMKSKDNNILPKLIEEYKTRQNEISEINEASFEMVYSQHMKMFNEDLVFVEELKNKQIILENKINELNNTFNEKFPNDKGDGSQSERKETLQFLEDVYSQYLQLITNLNEAAKFYNDFLTRGSSVITICDEFVAKRREEASSFEQEFVKQLTTTDNPTPARVITPIPVVPSPRPKPEKDNNISNKSDNHSSNELDQLQQQFRQTSIKKPIPKSRLRQ